MLLTIGFVVALASTYVEIKLVQGSSAIDRLYTHGLFGIRGVWFNTAGSFLLSFLIGAMFGATGVTVLFGGMLSTGLSQGYFSSKKWMNDVGWSWLRAKNETTTYLTDHRDEIASGIDRARTNIILTWQAICWVWRMLMLPFRMAKATQLAYVENRDRLVEFKQKALRR
jgi:hypothetical protein